MRTYISHIILNRIMPIKSQWANPKPMQPQEKRCNADTEKGTAALEAYADFLASVDISK